MRRETFQLITSAANFAVGALALAGVAKMVRQHKLAAEPSESNYWQGYADGGADMRPSEVD